MKNLSVLIMVGLVLGTVFTVGCTKEELVQQQSQVHEGRVIAIAPVVGGTYTNAYIVGAVVYFDDGSKVLVAGDLDLLIGDYYIITTLPPINEYWDFLGIDSIIHKP